ncbi:putative O-glycosylation ligase, exosortase A system-associated [Noviherbaspirillum suwonense]|uniref:Probable O-glycosylation ligase, exosortase A-associated n=1 Tax=Noviherbaspirillum suwonense TaxID=1224511 RepID=A0ABY1QJ60_9BURK|nr:putative O-glycosylation ligase, exosortase A system-associated [Noviherbaspirillum suwonense]SMP69469.1 probable O-glycosylation ligase, exosortase A-associated [Noviherbaspirillum suwonense]
MRDVVIFAIVFGLVPWMIKRPAIGALVFMWISLMNPHRLAYGPAYDFPFAMVVAVITIGAILFSREPRSYPATPVTVLLVIFMVWVTITTLFAISPPWVVNYEWSRVIKTLLMVAVTIMVVQTEADLKKMAWILVISLGIFGLKGGIFTLATGGSYRVLGPAGSYIAENNSLALAMVMAVPMIWYLRLQATQRWMRYGLTAMAGLTMIAAAGSYSRGALLAGAAMMGFLWLKSRNKVSTGLVLLMLIPLVWLAMPEQWHDRMSTINDYQTDGSAMGRINAWYFAMEVAKTHLMGGGFMVFNPAMFRIYAPNPTDFHAAHSIFFQVLGEHGYIGLVIFVSIIGTAWLTANKIIRTTRKHAELKWASDFAAMAQVSLIGYVVGGAFLSLAYYDYFWYVVAALVITQRIVARKLKPAVAFDMTGRELVREPALATDSGTVHARS